MAFKKKLHALRPDREPRRVETQRTRTLRRREPATPRTIERDVRQLLADKVCGNLVGLWLLVPEHLRLGTWDLLCGWTGADGGSVEPRVALQLVHEAALCSHGIRQGRSLSQKGFEAANGLPFIVSDNAVHDLLATRSVAQSQRVQEAAGRLRRASGHYRGRLLAVDPHRVRSYSRRQMRRRKSKRGGKAEKMAQTFFCVDLDTAQPVAFTTATAARSVSQATPELLRMVETIVDPVPGETLVLADLEHFSARLIDSVKEDSPFELMVPLPAREALRKRMEAIPPDAFTPQWAGYATAVVPYQLRSSRSGPCSLFVQRSGERIEEQRFKGFLCTARRDVVEALTIDYPKRWHIEEFFNTHQAMGWDRAGTQNLQIRYGQMSLALLAQAATHQLRRRLELPMPQWTAKHLADAILVGLDGDIRVWDDTVVVTYYNAPDAERLKKHYEGLPARLEREGVKPNVPWLYDLKLDFRFC